MRLALVEAKIAMARVLQRYRFLPAEGIEVCDTVIALFLRVT